MNRIAIETRTGTHRRKFALLAIALAFLAIASLLSYAWFASDTDPIKADVDTARIRVVMSGGQHTPIADGYLPDDTVTISGIAIKNESTRNAVARLRLNGEAMVLANWDNFTKTIVLQDGESMPYVKDINDGSAKTMGDFHYAMIIAISKASDPSYNAGGKVYITTAQRDRLFQIFDAAKNENEGVTTFRLPVSKEVVEFLKILNDNNLSYGNSSYEGAMFDISMSNLPELRAYLTFANAVMNDLEAMVANGTDAEGSSIGLDGVNWGSDNCVAGSKMIGNACYLALKPDANPASPTPVTFDLSFKLPQEWGDAYQQMQIIGLGIELDAVQATKAAVQDVYGLTEDEVDDLSRAFSGFVWTD